MVYFVFGTAVYLLIGQVYLVWETQLYISDKGWHQLVLEVSRVPDSNFSRKKVHMLSSHISVFHATGCFMWVVFPKSSGMVYMVNTKKWQSQFPYQKQNSTRPPLSPSTKGQIKRRLRRTITKQGTKRKSEKNKEHLLRSCSAACSPCVCSCCRSRSSCWGRLFLGWTWSNISPLDTSDTSLRMGYSCLPLPRFARWWAIFKTTIVTLLPVGKGSMDFKNLDSAV